MPVSASVVYLNHSGFMIAVHKTLLVFDYWLGENGALQEACRINDTELSQYDSVLFFVSHSHPDHFDPEIYRLKHTPEIQYVISYELPADAKGNRMKPGETLTLGSVTVKAYDSTDLGVSFYVETEGLRVFHAGDLNLWHWREESTLRQIRKAENDYYAAVEKMGRMPVDICMFPVDPRMGGLFDAGANHFIMTVKPRLFIPMHWQSRPEVANDFARRNHTKHTEVLALTKPRERAEVSIEGSSLHIQLFTPEPGSPVTSAEATMKINVDLRAYSSDDPFSDTDLPVRLSSISKPAVPK